MPCHGICKLRRGREGWLALFEKASAAASDEGAKGILQARNEAAINARSLSIFAAELDDAGDHVMAMQCYEQTVEAAGAELRRMVSQAEAGLYGTNYQAQLEDIRVRRAAAADRGTALRTMLGASAPAAFGMHEASEVPSGEAVGLVGGGGFSEASWSGMDYSQHRCASVIPFRDIVSVEVGNTGGSSGSGGSGGSGGGSSHGGMADGPAADQWEFVEHAANDDGVGHSAANGFSVTVAARSGAGNSAAAAVTTIAMVTGNAVDCAEWVEFLRLLSKG